MKPIGLTMKKSRNKYRLESRGELMMIHECTDCKVISINRIAADDDAETVVLVFRESLVTLYHLNLLCRPYGIIPLNDLDVVETQLFGPTAN
jgi:hypothetical protein